MNTAPPIKAIRQCCAPPAIVCSQRGRSPCNVPLSLYVACILSTAYGHDPVAVVQRETAARMGSGAMRGGPPPRGGDRGRRDGGDFGMAPRGQMGMCAPYASTRMLFSMAVHENLALELSVETLIAGDKHFQAEALTCAL